MSACPFGQFYFAKNTLEAKKLDLTQKLEEAKLQAEIHSPSEEMIRKYFAKDANIKEKSPDEQKRIIQAHVQKIIVYENEIEIYQILNIAGGGEPCLTIPLSVEWKDMYSGSYT